MLRKVGVIYFRRGCKLLEWSVNILLNWKNCVRVNCIFLILYVDFMIVL